MTGITADKILDHLKEGHILVHRKTGAVRSTNSAVKSIYGLSEAVVTQSPDSRFQCIHESERARIRALYERLLLHGISYTVQYRVIRPNGSVKWVEENSRVLKNGGDDFILTSVLASGIALQHWEEKQLRALNKIGKQLVNSDSFDAAASKVLETICSGLDWDLGCIWLLDPDRLKLTHAYEWSNQNFPKRRDRHHPVLFLATDGGSEFGEAFRSGRELWISDLEGGALPELFTDLYSSGLRACAVIPIKSRQFDYGFMLLFSGEPREQQNELLNTLRLIAAQMGRLIHCTSEENAAVQQYPGSAGKNAEIFVSKHTGKILNANQQAELFLSADRHVLAGMALSEILTVESSEPIDLSAACQEIDKKGCCRFSCTATPLNGSAVAVEVAMQNIPSFSDRVIEVSVTTITEAVAAADNGRDLTDDFHLLQNMKSAIAILDQNFNFIFASDCWLNDFGLTRRQVNGRGLSEVFEDSTWRWDTILARALNGENTACDEDEFTLPTGAKEWVSWSVSPWKDTAGKVSGILLCTRLVTQEHRARESLKQAEAKYRALFDNMLDGFAYHRIITNEQGDPVDYVFLEVNPAFEEMTGLKRSEILGRRVSEVLPQVKEDSRDWVGTYGQVALKGGQHRFEDYSKDLDKWYSVAAYCPRHGYFVVVIEDITKRKRAESELIEAGRTISTLLGNLPGMAYRCRNERSWRMEYVSGGVLELTGYEAEALLSNAELSYEDLILPEDREFVWEEVQSALRQNRPFRISYRIKNREGDIKWVWEQGCGVQDERGQVTALEGFITDVTERKRAEEALRSREEFYHELIDQSSDIFSIVDAEGNFLYRSTSSERTLGFSAEEMLQTNAFSYIHPEDISYVKSQFARVVNDKAEVTIAYRFRDANGNWRLLESKARNLLDNPHVRGIVINSRDITERSRVELELMKLVTAVEQAAEAIIITDTEGKIQYVNPAFEQIAGYERSAVIGRNPRLLRSGENNPKTYEEMWENITSGKHWMGRLVNRRSDGKEYHVEVAISPMRNDDGEIINYVAVQRDITKEKELEDQLRQAQKLEAVGRLASGIAHDFNNLLAGIRGFAELISLDTSVDHRIKSFADEIITASSRAADLTGQLLAFARQGNYLCVPLDVRVVIEEVVSILQRTIDKNITIETRLEAPNTIIKGDPSQLQSAILNLAVNARDAMPEGGIMTLRTKNIEVDTEFRQQHELLAEQSHFLAIEVTDTGIGIAADQLPHIFDPFFTTKPQGEGTGLGLAGVYGCAKNHLGSVFVESQSGEGTSFTLLLPLIEGGKPESNEDAAITSGPGGFHVVVVDDEDLVLKTAENILAKAGYHVTTCASGDAFLDYLKQEVSVDLALIDVVMPGISGQELFFKCREISPDLRVLLMSGFSDGQLYRSLDEGVAGFLPKPFDAKSLLAKIRDALKIGSAHSPSAP